MCLFAQFLLIRILSLAPSGRQNKVQYVHVGFLSQIVLMNNAFWNKIACASQHQHKSYNDSRVAAWDV